MPFRLPLSFETSRFRGFGGSFHFDEDERLGGGADDNDDAEVDDVEEVRLFPVEEEIVVECVVAVELEDVEVDSGFDGDGDGGDGDGDGGDRDGDGGDGDGDGGDGDRDGDGDGGGDGESTTPAAAMLASALTGPRRFLFLFPRRFLFAFPRRLDDASVFLLRRGASSSRSPLSKSRSRRRLSREAS